MPAMTRRHPGLVVLFTLITCGIYSFYWHYVSTNDLKTRTGNSELNPGLDLLLGIVTCGLYFIYSDYRNAQLLHRALSAGGPSEDKSVVVLVLHLGAFVVGFTGLVSMAIVQDELNKLYDRPASVDMISALPVGPPPGGG